MDVCFGDGGGGDEVAQHTAELFGLKAGSPRSGDDESQRVPGSSEGVDGSAAAPNRSEAICQAAVGSHSPTYLDPCWNTGATGR